MSHPSSYDAVVPSNGDDNQPASPGHDTQPRKGKKVRFSNVSEDHIGETVRQGDGSLPAIWELPDTLPGDVLTYEEVEGKLVDDGIDPCQPCKARTVIKVKHSNGASGSIGESVKHQDSSLPVGPDTQEPDGLTDDDAEGISNDDSENVPVRLPPFWDANLDVFPMEVDPDLVVRLDCPFGDMDWSDDEEDAGATATWCSREVQNMSKPSRGEWERAEPLCECTACIENDSPLHRCTCCDEKAVMTCKTCPYALYCSAACRRRDKLAHGRLICPQISEFTLDKRPSPNHFRAVLFERDRNSVRLIWVRYRVSDGSIEIRNEKEFRFDSFETAPQAFFLNQSDSLDVTLLDRGVAILSKGGPSNKDVGQESSRRDVNRTIANMFPPGQCRYTYGPVIAFAFHSTLDGIVLHHFSPRDLRGVVSYFISSTLSICISPAFSKSPKLYPHCGTIRALKVTSHRDMEDSLKFITGKAPPVCEEVRVPLGGSDAIASWPSRFAFALGLRWYVRRVEQDARRDTTISTLFNRMRHTIYTIFSHPYKVGYAFLPGSFVVLHATGAQIQQRHVEILDQYVSEVVSAGRGGMRKDTLQGFQEWYVLWSTSSAANDIPDVAPWDIGRGLPTLNCFLNQDVASSPVDVTPHGVFRAMGVSFEEQEHGGLEPPSPVVSQLSSNLQARLRGLPKPSILAPLMAKPPGSPAVGAVNASPRPRGRKRLPATQPQRSKLGVIEEEPAHRGPCRQM